MIFKSDPNSFCRISNKYVQRATGKKGFYFNDKGEYETENEVLIRVLLQSFATIERLETTEEIPAPKKHCTKCDFTCETHGILLAHYRKNHREDD